MKDLALKDGDISLGVSELVQQEYGTRRVKDLLVIDKETTLKRLLKRALITPITYIGREVINYDEGSDRLDLYYGNGLYLELSEPLTPEWLERANSHIRKALAFLPPDIQVNNTKVDIVSESSVSIVITYTFNNQLMTIQELIDINNLSIS
jgi:phage baseplate assembly protein W